MLSILSCLACGRVPDRFSEMDPVLSDPVLVAIISLCFLCIPVLSFCEAKPADASLPGEQQLTFLGLV